MKTQQTFIAKRYKPLCDMPLGLVCYHKGGIYLYHEGMTPLATVRTGAKSRIAEGSRLAERLTRAEPKCAVYWDDRLFFAMDANILCFSMPDKTVESRQPYRKAYIHTSRIAVIENVKGFDDCAAYGEYFDNPKREEVCVFTRRRGEAEFRCAYAFPAGTVRHIHTLIPDPANDCVYIFTGDRDAESGIWRAKDNFCTVEPLLVGNQDYRACIGFATGKQIVFATDIPSRVNHIVSYDLQSGVCTPLSELSGSCTTGCAWKDKLVFGSTVETVEPAGNGKMDRIKYLLGRKLAKGIQDDYARLYLGSPEEGFCEILRYKKDAYPAGLGQFGRINAVERRDGTLAIYPVAVKGADGVLSLLTTE